MNETERLLKCLPFTTEGVPGDMYPLVITKLYDGRYMIGYWKYGQHVDWSKATYLISFSDVKINKALKGLVDWIKEREKKNKEILKKYGYLGPSRVNGYIKTLYDRSST